MLPGVYIATKKNGEVYYRSSITYQNKHISLGSYNKELDAHSAYVEAHYLTTHPNITISDYRSNSTVLKFDKWISMINFRDNGIYIKNPIYLRQHFFFYYLSPKKHIIFDIDDLFYFSSHKIMQRQGYLFVSDYGMQVNILSRYGIKNHAVEGIDYDFSNGNHYDFRYENIVVINPYYGVRKIKKKNFVFFQTKIHLNGDYLVGNYETQEEAAVAYNKAVDLAKKNGWNKNFETNYILTLTAKDYADIYTKIKLSHRLLEYFDLSNQNSLKASIEPSIN